MRLITAPSDTEIQQATGIFTVDPSHPDAAGHHLWGERPSIPSDSVDPERDAPLEVELPSDDHVALLALIDRIERVKGSLPPDVVVLRKNLQG